MEFDVDLSRRVLERTPATLRALLAGQPDAWTRADEGPETFSPFDVVGHLISGEETDWLVRARLILAGNPEAQFTPYDRFGHRARDAGRTIESLLDEFATLRTANLETLASWRLGPEQLAMRGTHPRLGSVTLANLLATWVAHDLGHLAQCARVMAKQHKEAVGPWIAFLPVLTDHETPRS